MLSCIKPQGQCRFKLSSEYLSKDTLKILNKPVIWGQVISVEQLVRDPELMRVFSTKKKLFRIEECKSKDCEGADIEEFYRSLSDLE